jgi:hypothetical protein
MPEGTGLPQVLTEGKRKILTPADEKLLAEMEARYMREARKGPVIEPGTTEPGTPEAGTMAPPAADGATPAAPAAPAAPQ